MKKGQSLRAARVNDDYELELFKEELGPRPKRMGLHQLDYMFFCMNQDTKACLYTKRNYSEDYLKYLEKLGFVVPKIVHSGDYYNWYGRLQNIPKEKRLNSKLFSYGILNQLKLNPCPNFTVSSNEELELSLKTHPYPIWFLKCPFDMAGLGLRKIETDSDLPRINRPYVLEPILDRILDVSFYFNIRDKSVSFYRNLVLPGGQYYGGVLYEEKKDFETWMIENGFEDVSKKWFKVSEKILSEIMKEEPEQSFSVDSFFYKTDSGVDLHPMTEINYRETVGGCLLSLKPYLPEKGTGILITLPVTSDVPFNSFMPYSVETKKGIIYLSPHGSDQTTFFCSAATLKDAENLMQKYLLIAGISPNF